MESCSAVNEAGERCAEKGPHFEHMAKSSDPVTGEVRYSECWPNTEYVPSAMRVVTPQRSKREWGGVMADLIGSSKELARTDDPSTSHQGAKSVVYRAGTQKAALLAEFAKADDMTDEEAARACGLFTKVKCCWWHRVGDLARDGMLEPTGATRRSQATDEDLRVYRITGAGRAMARRIG